MLWGILIGGAALYFILRSQNKLPRQVVVGTKKVTLPGLDIKVGTTPEERGQSTYDPVSGVASPVSLYNSVTDSSSWLNLSPIPSDNSSFQLQSKMFGDTSTRAYDTVIDTGEPATEEGSSMRLTSKFVSDE